jgi:hypothetical protein
MAVSVRPEASRASRRRPAVAVTSFSGSSGRTRAFSPALMLRAMSLHILPMSRMANVAIGVLALDDGEKTMVISVLGNSTGSDRGSGLTR